MPVYPFHSFSLCSLISVPSTPLKRLNHNSSGNYSPARQQRSIWHLKPFLKAIFLLTSEGYNSPPYLFLFDRVSFLPFLLQVFLQISFLGFLAFHSIVPIRVISYFHNFTSLLGIIFQHLITKLGFSQEF